MCARAWLPDTDAVPDYRLFDLGDSHKFFVPEAPHFLKMAIKIINMVPSP